MWRRKFIYSMYIYIYTHTYIKLSSNQIRFGDSLITQSVYFVLDLFSTATFKTSRGCEFTRSSVQIFSAILQRAATLPVQQESKDVSGSVQPFCSPAYLGYPLNFSDFSREFAAWIWSRMIKGWRGYFLEVMKPATDHCHLLEGTKTGPGRKTRGFWFRFWSPGWSLKLILVAYPNSNYYLLITSVWCSKKTPGFREKRHIKSPPKPFEKDSDTFRPFQHTNTYKSNETPRNWNTIWIHMVWIWVFPTKYGVNPIPGSPGDVSQGLEALLLSPVLALDADSETWWVGWDQNSPFLSLYRGL